MTRRRSIVLLMMLVCCAGSSAAAAPRESTSAVSVRIHDYARFDQRLLQQAQRQVSAMYERIGVHIEWRAVARPSEIAAGRGQSPDDAAASVTVAVLAPEMSNRLKLHTDVAGYAPITREKGGRIAFVFGGRARAIAKEAGVDESQVLAGVIAHELAHLLMPERSHSRVGMMRPHWTPAEFRALYRARFSTSEAASIRKTARVLGGSPSRVAD